VSRAVMWTLFLLLFSPRASEVRPQCPASGLSALVSMYTNSKDALHRTAELLPSARVAGVLLLSCSQS
jgi:DNA-binding LacI/PurR family transcriptional regulator